MKKLIIASCLFALALATARAEEPVKIPTLAVGPQLIDGEIVDSCWEKAYKTGPFCRINGKTITEGAEAWIFTAQGKLYIAVKCEVKDKAKLEAGILKAKSCWDPGPVEIFIDPGDNGHCTQYAVNAAGFIMKPKIATDLQFGVQIHEHDWTLEMEIPFETIPLASEKSLGAWRLNIARGNYPIKESLSWAKLESGDFQDLVHFHRVTGLNADLKSIYNRQQLAKRKDFAFSTDRIILCGRDTLGVTADLGVKKSLKGWWIDAEISSYAESARTDLPKAKVSPLLLTNTFHLPVKGLANGRYKLSVSVKDADGKEVFAESSDFRIAPPAKPRKRNFTIENNNFFENGKLFFPIGIRAGGYSAPRRYVKEGKKNVLKGVIRDKAALVASNEVFFADIQAHGFNCVISGDANFSEEKQDDIFKIGGGAPWIVGEFVANKDVGMTFHDFATIAEKYNLGIIACSTYLTKFTPKNYDLFVEQICRIRDEENLLFWYTADETDGSLEFNRIRNRCYHEIDPMRVTWLNVINAIAQNKDFADVLSTDPYPVPGTRLTMVASHADRLKNIIGQNPKQTWFLWIQDFGGEKCWPRPPTPAERRVMALLALTHGVKGIFYFTYFPESQRNGVRQHKEAWNTIGALNREIQANVPITCLGKFLGTQRVGFVDVSAYEYQGKKTVYVINTDKDPVKGVKIDLPGIYTAELDLDGFAVEFKH